MMVLGVAMVTLMVVLRIAFTDLPLVIPVRFYDSLPTPVPRPSPLLSTNEPYRIGGAILAPVLVSRGKSAEWIGSNPSIQGVVILETVVDADGQVASVRILRGISPDGDSLAMRGVKLWRYRPATLHGKPVRVYLTVAVHFRGAV